MKYDKLIKDGVNDILEFAGVGCRVSKNMTKIILSENLPSHVWIGKHKVFLDNHPSVANFSESVNAALQNPEPYLVEFVNCLK